MCWRRLEKTQREREARGAYRGKNEHVTSRPFSDIFLAARAPL